MNSLSSSSSSPNPKLILFSSIQNPNSNSNSNPSSKFNLKIPIRTPQSLSSQKSSSSSSPVLHQNPQSSQPSLEDTNNEFTEEIISSSSSSSSTQSLEELLVVRRPVMEFSGEEEETLNEAEGEGDATSPPSAIDKGLSKLAKKMPIFEPQRVESRSELEKPLVVNLDLALYRAKVLARKYHYQEAETILHKCINYWPEDGRSYVALGKILGKRSKTAEARSVYEKGCQATQGENPYIWQCWAVLENKMGNIRRARELFDAATVADKKHIAAWHGWAVLELKQGNIKKARNLLGKGLKYCGGNEYIYQTLALLEAKADRFEQARYLFRQATKCNPKSCASWLAWAQLEMQQESYRAARQLFEKAVQASPKNRFAWHVWGVFEANLENVDQGRKLLKIGHALNPKDPVLLQSLALLEYKHSTANLARVLFRRASELDPMHQPVWIAWGWMEWKEGNIATARELYQKALSIDSTTESAARCLQAWGVLEQRVGNLSAARRLFRSSLNINSQSYVTWTTWASLEEDQGNSVRAEEIRNLYFQQRTEVVDDASWVMGFFDIIDPAIDNIKRFLKLNKNTNYEAEDSMRNILRENKIGIGAEPAGRSSDSIYDNNLESRSGFNLDTFVREKLSLDPSKLVIQMESSERIAPPKVKSPRRVWRLENSNTTVTMKN